MACRLFRKMNQYKIIMLGTGNAMVTKCYNTCFAISDGNEYLLVDAGGGNGILRQIELADIPYSNMHKMIITHCHTDHILGAIWIIRKIASMMEAKTFEGKFELYCHKEAAEVLNIFCQLTLVKKFLKYMDDRILIHEVENAAQIMAVGMQITFFDIYSTKIKQFGFTAKLPDGTKITCLGDEPYNERCEVFVKESDWLMSEAFCLESQKDKFKPHEKYHSTVIDSGKMAAKLEVKHLILYHTEDKNIKNRKSLYLEELRTVFSGDAFVPDDLDVIEIQ
ncbi:MAG: MBL fold metallo-hydrolase [Candidatus Fimimorpha sp.]